MGVDYFNCVMCTGIDHDAGGYRCCEKCGKFICEDCVDVAEHRHEKRVLCSNCTNPKIPSDTLLTFLLKKAGFESEEDAVETLKTETKIDLRPYRFTQYGKVTRKPKGDSDKEQPTEIFNEEEDCQRCFLIKSYHYSVKGSKCSTL